jgi:hypothetical protein
MHFRLNDKKQIEFGIVEIDFRNLSNIIEFYKARRVLLKGFFLVCSIRNSFFPLLNEPGLGVGINPKMNFFPISISILDEPRFDLTTFHCESR